MRSRSVSWFLLLGLVGCEDPDVLVRDAGVPSAIDGAVPGVDPAVTMGASDEGAFCAASMIATSTGIAIAYERHPLGGEAEVVFARVDVEGTVEQPPVQIQSGLSSSLWLMADGEGFTLQLGSIGHDLDASGAVSASSAAPSGIETSYLQIAADEYWALYTKNNAGSFRAYFSSFGPGRSNPTPELRLFPTTEEEQSGVRGAVVGDGVWLAYRRAATLRIGKVDLDGTETLAPKNAITFPNVAQPNYIAANAAGMIAGSRADRVGPGTTERLQVFDASGGLVGERIELTATREDRLSFDLATSADTFYVVYERDLEGALTRIAVERVEPATGLGTTELLTPAFVAADCPVAVVVGDRLAVSYRAFDPGPVRRVRFYDL